LHYSLIYNLLLVTTNYYDLQTQKKTVDTSDRTSELKAFDDTKAGVKGLLDAGVKTIPRIFHSRSQPNVDQREGGDDDARFSIPTIDLQGGKIQADSALRAEVMEKVRHACEKWGFFQVVNHGIPVNVLDEVIRGIREFHEQDSELKKEFYTRTPGKKVYYHSNYDLYQASSTDWRDTLGCFMAPNPPKPEELPSVCRDIVIEYSKHVMEVGLTLFEILSESLGLNPNHLKDMNCAEGLLLLGHCYPACPEPDLTFGASKHTDGTFITILLQDQVGGLQALYENQWVNVPPMYGALVVNVGDLLQLITNDKFISLAHRVRAKNVGPRTSVASFFRSERNTKVFGPIKELLSEENPQIYQEVDIKDYVRYYYSEGKENSPLLHFKL
ncbi:PREDICTED: 1-aminocyclopropane-1-carboxylate oxidase homolog 1-like, partial [Fragaria vesca subsp. vesca]